MPAAFDAVTFAVFAALGLLSATALAVTLYKAIQFARLGLGRRRAAEAILADWTSGQRDRALAAAAGGRGVIERVLHATFAARLRNPHDPAASEELGRQAALAEMARLGASMRLIEGVVQAAPMLGLLGTVIGMIEAFGTLAAAGGAADPALLAEGIWTALTTTAVGLSIALVFYFVSLWLEGRIEAERQGMELAISVAVHGARAAPGDRAAPLR